MFQYMFKDVERVPGPSRLGEMYETIPHLRLWLGGASACAAAEVRRLMPIYLESSLAAQAEAIGLVTAYRWWREIQRRTLLAMRALDRGPTSLETVEMDQAQMAASNPGPPNRPGCDFTLCRTLCPSQI